MVIPFDAIMPIERIDDWDQRIKRQDACWDCAVLDRPTIRLMVPTPNPQYPYPSKTFKTWREKWYDFEYFADLFTAITMNTTYLGDGLPWTFPNLGPEMFSCWFGQEMEYSETTSWSIPILEDWADADKLQFSMENEYWKQVVKFTDVLLEAGKGKFYVGMTDIHPGADAIAAFRDPQQLNLDLLLYPNEIKKMLNRVTDVFFKIYDFYAEKLVGAGQACTNWTGQVSSRLWAVPSNDFSCMISKEMFDEFFLEGLRAECDHTEANTYHLDGPDALKHLDSLLGIKNLSTVQWVFGAGHGRASDWLPVYKKIQSAGKGVHLDIGVDEVEFMIENLRPEGVNMGVYAPDLETAQAVMRRIGKWK